MQPERIRQLARRWWHGAAALAGSLLLSAAPLPPGDPFRTTLPIVPWVAVGLVEVGRWAAAHGTRWRRGTASVELAALSFLLLAALGFLLLSVLGRSHLGLGPSLSVDALLAAGLLLLLALRLAVLLPALRPSLGRKLPVRPPWPFFVLPLLAGRRRGGSRLLVAALGALTVVLALLWLAVPGWTYNLADGSSHLLGYLNERLGTDAGRLFPSFVRGRTATWWWPAAGGSRSGSIYSRSEPGPARPSLSWELASCGPPARRWSRPGAGTG